MVYLCFFIYDCVFGDFWFMFFFKRFLYDFWICFLFMIF